MADKDKEKDIGKVPASFQISRQLDQEKIDFLTRRIEDLLSSNNDLRTSASRNEKDTHDIVLYFQREMEMKDEIIARLNEELVKRETQLKFEVEKMRKKFDSDLHELRNQSDETISDLTSKLGAAEKELIAVDIYVKDKQSFNMQLKQLEKDIQDQRQQMFDALEEQERKFLEEKSQIFKDLDEQKALFRDIALKEAREAMGVEIKKILSENDRMHEELKFLHSTLAELQADQVSLKSELSMAKRDVTILTEKEIEYAKLSFYKTKEIKALRERVEYLEKQSVVNVERFKQRTKELKSTVHKELEDATLDAAGLRRLLKIKNQELRNIKSLAATILSQRSETEQFFLEALQEVKDVIRKEKKRTALETKITLNKMKAGAAGPGSVRQGLSKSYGGGALPQIQVKGANLHHLDERTTSNLATVGELEKVEMKDLSWEDKELVLRVLFAKMNGQQKAVESAVAQSAMAATKHQRDLRAMTIPDAVFVSEGAGVEGGQDATMYQLNFEVGNYDSDEASQHDGDETSVLTDNP